MEHLRILIPHLSHKRYIWFYCRKALFQVIMPILLALFSLLGFTEKSHRGHGDSAYLHLYFYTTFILFLYGVTNYVLKYIFSISSDKIMFKKEINLVDTTPNLIIDTNDTRNELCVVMIKKVFKIRYSQNVIFQNINKLCWLLGMDSPILIPSDIILKLSSVKDITPENEDTVLQETLFNLCTYHPAKYNYSHNEQEINDTSDILISSYVETPLDMSIRDMQFDLFNKTLNNNLSNVKVV